MTALLCILSVHEIYHSLFSLFWGIKVWNAIVCTHAFRFLVCLVAAAAHPHSIWLYPHQDPGFSSDSVWTLWIPKYWARLSMWWSGAHGRSQTSFMLSLPRKVLLSWCCRLLLLIPPPPSPFGSYRWRRTFRARWITGFLARVEPSGTLYWRSGEAPCVVV